MIVVRMQKRIGNLPPMPLELSKYKNPVVLIDGSEHGKDYSEWYKTVSGSACKEVESIRDTILHLVIRCYCCFVSFTLVWTVLDRRDSSNR